MEKSEIMELARQERNHYYRQWRVKNPDKVKRSQERYWARKAEERKEAEENAKNENH